MSRVKFGIQPTGQCRCNLVGHRQRIGSACFSFDSSLILSVDSSSFRVWDATSGDLKLHSDVPENICLPWRPNVLQLAAFSSDSDSIIMATECGIHSWDLNSGTSRSVVKISELHRATFL